MHEFSSSSNEYESQLKQHKSKQLYFYLGDFGYARTIHEHSLRYTKVGTTAYLPPEVSLDQWRRAKGYNKTVEYVIIYSMKRKQQIILHLF